VLLGRLGAQLAVFREQFVARCGPKAVQTAVECKAYDTGPMIEVWAELRSRTRHVVDGPGANGSCLAYLGSRDSKFG
jgi:hypothetical protein